MCYACLNKGMENTGVTQVVAKNLSTDEALKALHNLNGWADDVNSQILDETFHAEYVTAGWGVTVETDDDSQTFTVKHYVED